MPKAAQVKSTIVLGGAGCLFLALSILNLLFGWIFLNAFIWLVSESMLFLLFVITSGISTRRVFSTFSQHQNDNVIDVTGKIVEDKKKLN